MATSATGTAHRGRAAFLTASLTAQLCALLRYTLLARLLGPEQLGIAVAIILTAQFFEALTDSGSDRFLVQDPKGNDPDVQAMVHSMWMVRGLAIAILLVLLARPIADFYATPGLSTGLMILALSPLIAGFAHLDYRRLQRECDFRAESKVLIASEALSLAVTTAAALVTRDFTAILYGLIARSAAIALLSHLTAVRRYRLGLAPKHAARLATFGLPLMLNGALLFLSGQGDRILIGHQLGLEALGHYSAALLLIYYPTGMIMRYMTTVHLPLIAVPRDEEDRRRAADDLGGQTLLMSTAFMIGFTACAPTAIALLFGPQFEQSLPIVAAVGVLQTIRFARLWPVTVALAAGRSDIVLLSNLLRLLAFPAALIALAFGSELTGILLAFAFAEFVTFLIVVLVVYRRLPGSRLRSIERAGQLAAFALLLPAWAISLEAGAGRIPLLLSLAIVALGTWALRREQRMLEQAVALLKQAFRRG